MSKKTRATVDDFYNRPAGQKAGTYDDGYAVDGKQPQMPSNSKHEPKRPS